MRIITANIGRKSSVQHTRADFETIRRLRGITGFQEIDEDDPPQEHNLLKAILGRGFRLAGLSTYVPVAVPRRGYKVVNSRIVYGCRGLKRYSPNRYFTVVTIKKHSLVDRLRKRNEKVFVVINVHYPAGAYHGHRPAPARRELQSRWDQLYAKHRSLAKHYADKGITVFWTGDTNRVDMPKVHPRERRVVTAGIDSISYVEGKVKVRVRRKGSRRLFSDHNAQFADFDLS